MRIYAPQASYLCMETKRVWRRIQFVASLHLLIDAVMQ